MRTKKPIKLSRNDQTLCALVVAGLTNKAIAARLHCSPGAASNRLSRLYDRMRVPSTQNPRTELINMYLSGEWESR